MPQLATMENCTGCTACTATCTQSCISMLPDENGFLFPSIDEGKCIGCGLCERVCPIKINTLPKTYVTPPVAYAAYSKDEKIRVNSSSGGIFSEIAKKILEDGGVVFGAAYNERFEVVHVCVENEKALSKLRGAKYAQSELNNTFVEIRKRLDGGQKVLFSGTPCQVAGLKASLQKKYKSLFCVDFVCLSVPSPMAWLEYVKFRSEQDCEGKLPVSVNLRSKTSGWSHYSYSNLFEYPEGILHSVKSGESLYMKLFGGGYISRKSCENCKFKGYNRESDLTIGDFWGIWDLLPEMDDNKGVSVVLVQSENGKLLLERISDKLVMKHVTLEEASRQNRAMLESIQLNSKREDALLLIKNGDFLTCQTWLENTKLQKQRERKVKQLIRRLKNIIQN